MQRESNRRDRVSQLIQSLEEAGELNQENAESYHKATSKIIWLLIGVLVLAMLPFEDSSFRNVMITACFFCGLYYWDVIYMGRVRARYLLYTQGVKTKGEMVYFKDRGRYAEIAFRYSVNNTTYSAVDNFPKGLLYMGDETEVLYDATFPDKVRCIYHPKLVSAYNLSAGNVGVAQKKSFLKGCRKLLSKKLLIVLSLPYLAFTYGLLVDRDTTLLRAKTYVMASVSFSDEGRMAAEDEWEINKGVRYLHAYLKTIGDAQSHQYRHKKGIEIIVRHGEGGANALADAIFANDRVTWIKGRHDSYSVSIIAAEPAIKNLIPKMTSPARGALKARLENAPENLSKNSQYMVKKILKMIAAEE